eukprot:scaffold847_cov172-Ochromonas_danica.AAC.21
MKLDGGQGVEAQSAHLAEKEEEHYGQSHHSDHSQCQRESSSHGKFVPIRTPHIYTRKEINENKTE